MTPAGNGRSHRVVLTGGPGGGKTTAADLLRREVGEKIVVVPESATLLFGGGFPRESEPAARRSAQNAIFHVQRGLEDVYGATYPDRVLLCDRGTVDGAVYWPGTPDEFFETAGTTLEQELGRYDRVLFFETAAVGGISIEGGNPVRTEDQEQAIALDTALRDLWSQHSNFTLIRHDGSFLKKIFNALSVLTGVVDEHGSASADARAAAADG
ncbi:MAG: AAA family ATPase [Nannocystales bacterium]